MNLNANEKKVLAYLADEVEAWWGFAAIGECVPLDRKAIRRACRSLARKGLTEFRRGLWYEDGGMAGSGYGITEAGRECARSSCG